MVGTQILVHSLPGIRHKDFGAGLHSDLTRVQFNKTKTSVIYNIVALFSHS